MKAILSTTH